MRTGAVRNERGASIVMVSVALFAMLGMAAVAIDLGMLLKVRSDAQRVADAAALAGAIEYKNGNSNAIRDKAADSALKYAGRNYAGWQSINTTGPIVMDSGTRRIINSPEAYIQSIPEEYKVRVWIRRGATATWFGNLLGLDWVPIAAKAAAHVANAGTGKCIKPLVIPDLWNETDNSPPRQQNKPGQDVNNNDAWDVGEAWKYEPP
ncbi:MAG TPA: pilus assembly protein TadG-related protein, partial [Gemmatimonadales bacterium]|nr:pilus assembly protein TadG-related protein [Gemmatimonadales bacterium]